MTFEREDAGLFMDPLTPINPYKTNIMAPVPNWLLVRRDISDGAKLLYARLQQYFGDNGVACPYIATLAEELGKSPRQISNIVAELKKYGLIKVISHNSEGLPNEYEFLAHPLWQQAQLKNSPKPSSPSSTGIPPQKIAGYIRKKLRDPQAESFVTPTQKVAPLVKRIIEKNHRKESERDVDASLTTSSNTASQTREPQTREGCAPSDRNLNPKNAATDELGTVEPFDLNALIRDNTANARRRASEVLMGSAAQKTLDEKARKQAKRYQAEERRKARAKVDAESGAEPLEAPEKTPRAQLFHVWREELASAFPDYPIPRQWSGREWGQAQLLLEKYDLDQVEIAIAYVIRNWEALGKRFFKGKADPTPSIGVILALDASIFPQSVVWAQHGVVIEEYRAYGDDNVRRPEDLEIRYIESRKQLKNLGLI